MRSWSTGQNKEFITGPPHDVTNRTFVVQRVFRLSDSLPQETVAARWRWERGGWLLVNRVSGKMQLVPLPEFDPYNSEAVWFRDYAAYCGVSDDGKKVSAILVQLGRRKPLLKKALGGAGADMQEAKCGAPIWQRAPSRVTFEPKGEQKFTFTVPTRGGGVGYRRRKHGRRVRRITALPNQGPRAKQRDGRSKRARIAKRRLR